MFSSNNLRVCTVSELTRNEKEVLYFLSLVPLFTKVWEAAICDVTKSTLTSSRLVTAPPVRCRRYPLTRPVFFSRHPQHVAGPTCKFQPAKIKASISAGSRCFYFCRKPPSKTCCFLVFRMSKRLRLLQWSLS